MKFSTLVSAAALLTVSQVSALPSAPNALEARGGGNDGHICGSSQFWDWKNRCCSEKCHGGDHWDGYGCHHCGEGEEWRDNHCRSQCHGDSHWYGGGCKTCNPWEYWGGSGSGCLPRCHGDEHWDGKHCHKCYGWEHWDGNRCVGCPPGKEWKDGQCRDKCGDDYYWGGGICISRCQEWEHWDWHNRRPTNKCKNGRDGWDSRGKHCKPGCDF